MNENLTIPDPATLARNMQAVQEFAERGTPIDPAALARIRARASEREPAYGTASSTSTNSVGPLPMTTNETRSR